jgi:hypothetical protein
MLLVPRVGCMRCHDWTFLSKNLSFARDGSGQIVGFLSLCSGLVVCQCPPRRLDLWRLTISLFFLFGSLKLLSAPTMLPCSHTSCRFVTTLTTEPMGPSLCYPYRIVTNFLNSFSTCATTQTMDGYSCAICKIPYQSQGTNIMEYLYVVYEYWILTSHLPYLISNRLQI